jgi:hypothetical protein
MNQTINFNATLQAVAQAISQAHGVPVDQVLADLQAGLQQRGVPRFGRLRTFSRPSYGDDVLSTILPDTSTSGLFGAPAVALYAFGAVILGIGLLVALKKKS